MKAERKLEPVKDASHLYEVERRDRHAERPGFRISELQLSPTQTVPWHFHTNISDTFYVLQGKMRLFLQNPKQEVRLGVGRELCRRRRPAAPGDQRRRQLAHVPDPARRRRVRLRAAGLDLRWGRATPVARSFVVQVKTRDWSRAPPAMTCYANVTRPS